MYLMGFSWASAPSVIEQLVEMVEMVERVAKCAN